MINLEDHQLLEPVSHRFSKKTVQRAFIVWNYLGQNNKFRDVCNYYHRLEELENTYTDEARKDSQELEYNLQYSQPPMSRYFLSLFPNLYPTSPRDPIQTAKANNIIQLQQGQYEGATNEDIIAVSQMIRNYCKLHKTTSREFLFEFRDYAINLGVNPTVSNVAFYIQHKNILAERESKKKAENVKDSKKIVKPTENSIVKGKDDNSNVIDVNINEPTHFVKNNNIIDVHTLVNTELKSDDKTDKNDTKKDGIDDIINKINSDNIEIGSKIQTLQYKKEMIVNNSPKKNSANCSFDNLILESISVDTINEINSYGLNTNKIN